MLQSSSRTIRSDSKSGRFYAITDPATGETASYPSVTTILSAINKPALLGWAAKEERAAVSEASADLYAELAAHPQLPRAMYTLALEQRLGKTKAHLKKLQAAAEIGTKCHSAVEWTLKLQVGGHAGPEPVLDDAAARQAFLAWQEFARTVALVPLAVEQVVWSHTHRFAGTMDLLAELDTQALLTVLRRQGQVPANLAAWLEGRTSAVALIDLKTSKAVWGEHLLQSVAYQRALAEMGHGSSDGGLIVRLPKVTSDPGFQVVVVPPARDLFPTFLAARQVWQWQYEEEQAYRERTKLAKVG